jgi:tripartite-type tricarboxylate transporter receptor subunit TctC
VSALVKGADMHEQLGARGVVVQTQSPREFADFIKADIDKWRDVMRVAGIPQE